MEDNVTKSVPTKKAKKSVRFDTLEMRQYPIILGNNPAVSMGPPLTIDWEYDIVGKVSLDEYEEGRGDRRNKEQMMIPVRIREDWLREAGYSRGDMTDAIKEAVVDKKSRNASSQKIRMCLEETTERLQRKVQRWVLRDPPKRALYEAWLSEQDKTKGSSLPSSILVGKVA